MRISTRGRYAVRSMFELAIHEKEGPISLNHISKVQSISRSYLEQLFIKLRKSGLVTTVRGPAGGYLLNKKPKDITIGEIIRAVNEPIAPVYCVDKEIDRRCDRAKSCVCNLYWEKLRSQIAEFLESNTLFDLCEEATKIK